MTPPSPTSTGALMLNNEARNRLPRGDCMTRTANTDRDMWALIARLNLLSNVPASAPSSAGGPATDEHPGGRLPKGGGMSGHDWWQRYVTASNPERIVVEAQATLDAAHHGPAERPAGETPEQEVARKTSRVLHLHADGSWTTVDIARDTGLTIGQVAKLVMGAAIAARLTARERATTSEVIRLWEEDPARTVRYLAARTNTPKSTVQDILRAHAVSTSTRRAA